MLNEKTIEKLTERLVNRVENMALCIKNNRRT